MTRDKIGKVSGNLRIDPSTLEEREEDTDDIMRLWVEELAKDKEFLADVTEEMAKWKDIIASTGCDPGKITVHMVGESHLDMAYKWRYEQTIKKAKRTLTKAIKHAKNVPGFRFAVSSPQIMAWLKESYPEFYIDVKEFVKKGSIELVGGSWVEADCNMPSGEAFVRQRLHGMMLYRDEFGRLPEAEWFPDTFGYNAGLPQILAKSGTKYFLTSKMTWNATNEFPLTHFWWASPDGSKVLVTSSRTGVNLFAQFSRYGIYRRMPKAGTKTTWTYEDEFADLVRCLDNSSWVPAIGLFMGKGDGGHGPTHQEVGSMIAFAKTSASAGMHVK
jgi:alpha-mannosidase